MDESFAASVEFTLTEEGGYIDNAGDPRFASNGGITLARLRRFPREPGPREDDIGNLPCATVRAPCMACFWNRTRCDTLRPGIAPTMFDHAVNAGPIGRVAPCNSPPGINAPRSTMRSGPTHSDGSRARMRCMQGAGYRQMATFGLFGEDSVARLDRRRAKARGLMTGRRTRGN
jgi:lysozyme family protein